MSELVALPLSGGQQEEWLMRSISVIVGASLLMGGLATVSPAVSGGLEAQAAPAGRVPADGYEVFRPYGAAGGLKDEFEQLAAEHPDITKLVTIGQTVQGEDIVALKVSRHASRIRDGRRPATLYIGGQHGREWISPGDRAPPRPSRGRRLRHRPHTHRPGRHDRAVVRAGRQPRRLRLLSSHPATGCGARTCATTTATAGSPPSTAWTPTATTRPSGATTTRARRPMPAARPTGEPAPPPSPRPGPSTG